MALCNRFYRPPLRVLVALEAAFLFLAFSSSQKIGRVFVWVPCIVAALRLLYRDTQTYITFCLYIIVFFYPLFWDFL